MKTVYKSKVDKGLLIAIIAIVLLSYLPLLFEFSWIALALLVVTAAFIADPFCNTSYTIDNGTLHIKCGIFLSSSFPIDRITKISKTNSCLSAPALSMDRIEIRFADKKTLVLSPKQRQAFIDHLRSLNPECRRLSRHGDKEMHRMRQNRMAHGNAEPGKSGRQFLPLT